MNNNIRYLGRLALLSLLCLLLWGCQKKSLPLAETTEPADKPAYKQEVNLNK